jgi:gliding motility-associated-like protein
MRSKKRITPFLEGHGWFLALHKTVFLFLIPYICYPHLFKMNRPVALLVFLLFFNLNFTFAQVSLDTANYPYWIDMMQDPSIKLSSTQSAFNRYWENRSDTKGNGFKPFKRWEYNMLEIVDSAGYIPTSSQLNKAVQDYINYRNKINNSGGGNLPGVGGGAAFCLTEGLWEEIGPNDIPGNRTGQPNGLGRINGLAFHPTDSNIIYAGAPAGGLWRTVNGGITWQSNTDTLVTLGVSSIAVDPQHPDTIYLGTGDRDASDSYGKGVVKSIDGGATWFSSNTGMGNRVVGRLIVDPRNSSILLAATNGGIYRSTNYGSNWTRVNTGNHKELVFDAINPDFVYAAAGKNFYRSTDNGQNWTLITSGFSTGGINRMVIGVTPADSNFVYVLATGQRVFEGLYLSTDRGVTFTQMSNTPNIMDYSHLGTGTSGQAWYDLDMAVDPNDKSIIYSAGVNIFQSLDSGKTWKINAHWVGSGSSPKVHADNHVLEYQPNTNTLYTGNDGGVYYTKNLGKTWPDISNGLGISQIYRLGQSTQDPDMIINGYQDNGTGLREGDKWFTVMGGDGMDCVIDPKDDTYAYSDLYYGDIRRYVNGYYSATIGKNGKNGITESGGWVTPFILQEADPKMMIAGYKNVWITPDARANSITWTKISDNLGGSNSSNISHLENSIADPERLYVARSDKKLFRTDNLTAATPTWTDLSSGLPFTGSIQWLESHNKLADRLWICGSNKIYQSDNGGTSWTDISTGLPSLPVISVTLDTSSALQGMYAGTYMGVFYRDTTMSSWQWFNNNMPTTARVRDIELYYSPSGRDQSHVVCATYGRGNWKSPLYDENQNIPVAAFSVSKTNVCLNSSIQLKDTSSNTPTQWHWRIRPTSISFLKGTDSCSKNPVVQFNQKGKYSIELVATNCMGADSLTKSEIVETFDAVKPAKCINVTKNIGSYGIGLYGVNIHNYSNTSGGVPQEGAYVDQACKEVIQLKTDTTYAATITTGTTYDEYVKVFIDFNNDGDMDDLGEVVFSKSKARTIHQDSIRIPITPVTNTLLRMRVMSDFDSIPDDACDTLRYGQTEDYGVIFEPRIPKINFGIDTNRICKNGEITLIDSSEGSVYNQKWVVSKYDQLTFKSDSVGPIRFILPDTGWYYAALYLNDSIVSKRIDSIVYVLPIPDASIKISYGSISSCQGDSLLINAQTFDPENAMYTWFKNGQAISGESDSTIGMSKLADLDSGFYKVEVNRLGCGFMSDSLKIRVNPIPVASFISNSDSFCFNTQNFVFTNTSTISRGAFSNSWRFGDGNISTNHNPTHIYSDTGQYRVDLIVASGTCTDTVSRMLRVNLNPTADFGINTAQQCLEENAFIFTQSSSNGAEEFLWDFGNSTFSTQENDTVAYDAIGNYSVQLVAVSNRGCTDTLAKQIVVNASPKTAFSAVGSDRCLATNSFDFVNNSSISSGVISKTEWTFEDGSTSSQNSITPYSFKSAGNHQIMLITESDQGCKDTFIELIDIFDSPTADFNLNDDAQCFTQHIIQLNNASVISGSAALTYRWSLGEGNTSTQTNPVAYKLATSGKFSIELIAMGSNSCNDTIVKDLTLYPSPVLQFNANDGCVGEQITFSNTSTISSGSISRFEWTFGDGQSSTIESPYHAYTNPGIYQVELIAESDQGCLDTLVDKSATEIFSSPNANFSFEKLGSYAFETEMLFTDLSDNAVTWQWLFGNLGGSNERHPSFKFMDTGNVVIRLAVTNDKGCYDTMVQTVFVFPDAAFLMPNSFTPNNDGINDQLKASGVSFVQEFRMEIFNGWGQRVFFTENAQEAWDGKFGGEYVTPGTYLVVVEYKDFNNQIVRESLPIVLMR